MLFLLFIFVYMLTFLFHSSAFEISCLVLFFFCYFTNIKDVYIINTQIFTAVNDDGIMMFALSFQLFSCSTMNWFEFFFYLFTLRKIKTILKYAFIYIANEKLSIIKIHCGHPSIFGNKLHKKINNHFFLVLHAFRTLSIYICISIYNEISKYIYIYIYS